MKKAYLGIDIGSEYIKGVIVDENKKIISSSYLKIKDNPIKSVKEVIKKLRQKIDLNKYAVVGIGTTGLYRKIIGTILGANTIRNEIITYATGIMSIYPNVKTVFEIGANDSKIILIENKKIIDYNMNNLCASSIGTFLTNYSKKQTNNIFFHNSYSKKENSSLEPNLLFKLHICYSKQKKVSVSYNELINNYLLYVVGSREIKPPIVFGGGVSKNKEFIKNFESIIGYKIHVNKYSHLMGALGAAILSMNEEEINFSFNIKNIEYEIKQIECNCCSKKCQIIKIMKNNKTLDLLGKRCKKEKLVH